MQKLINKAIEVRNNAYTPYSNFKVGAAVLLKDGKTTVGCNVENASYGLCNCAERGALFAAYTQGYRKDDIVALAVVGNTEHPISPCGACRQVMNELMSKTTPVYLCNLKGDIKETTIGELLPYSFDEVKSV